MDPRWFARKFPGAVTISPCERVRRAIESYWKPDGPVGGGGCGGG